MAGCADVCLDYGYDYEGTFFYERLIVSRKSHVCCECGLAISRGDAYWMARGADEGSIWCAKTCPTCYEIREAFVCGSWTYGELWTAIREGMFPIWNEKGPIDCLMKVESLEARNVLRKRYAEWGEEPTP